MNESGTARILLDPQNRDTTIQALQRLFDLPSAELPSLGKVLALLPRPAYMHYDEALAAQYGDLPLADRFTFNVETDELIVFAHDSQTLIDALLEMAMYLSGFTTKLGNPEAWVVEFTIGAWKTVTRRIKRQLQLPVADQPIAIIGLNTSSSPSVMQAERFFRQLVAHYDKASFHQMIVLAARENILVQFPAETHPKVRALYLHARRAMQEIGQGLTLSDHRIFNRLLNDAIQRIEQLFAPSTLGPPTWLQEEDLTERPDLTSPGAFHSASVPDDPDESLAPFETFLDELFPDEDDPLDDDALG